MQFSVTFRHMEATEALKEYARDRMKRIKKYFPDPISVQLTLSTERYNHKADVLVQLHNGLKLAGHESTEDMYSSIDLVVAKIERQVRRYKDKLRTHKVRTDFAPLPWTHSVVTELAQGVGSRGPQRPATGDGEPQAPVVKKKEKFHADPMSVSEAIMQLNLLHEQFLVFRCEQTGQVNVVYRRDDGSFGLIETSPSA